MVEGVMEVFVESGGGGDLGVGVLEWGVVFIKL